MLAGAKYGVVGIPMSGLTQLEARIAEQIRQ